MANQSAAVNEKVSTSVYLLVDSHNVFVHFLSSPVTFSHNITDTSVF